MWMWTWHANIAHRGNTFLDPTILLILCETNNEICCSFFLPWKLEEFWPFGPRLHSRLFWSFCRHRKQIMNLYGPDSIYLPLILIPRIFAPLLFASYWFFSLFSFTLVILPSRLLSNVFTSVQSAIENHIYTVFFLSLAFIHSTCVKVCCAHKRCEQWWRFIDTTPSLSVLWEMTYTLMLSLNTLYKYFTLCILLMLWRKWFFCVNGLGLCTCKMTPSVHWSMLPSRVISNFSLTEYFSFSILQIYPEIDFANCPKMLPVFHFSKHCSCTTIHCDRFQRRFEACIHYRFWIYGKLVRREGPEME